jgi:TonB family protein
MYFDFDDRYTDIEPVGSAINRRDGVAMAVVVHLLVIAAILFLPQLLSRPTPDAQKQPPPPHDDPPLFVNVNPKIDLPALKKPQRAEMSDLDRSARALERAPDPTNPLPAAKGNSAERAEATPEEIMKGKGEAPQPAPEAPPVEQPQMPDPRTDPQLALNQRPRVQPPGGGSLGEALKNLQKYVQSESFNNQKSNVQEFGPLQFDTKGVEFGPWVRRFVSQVRRNWFVPYAAMTMRGRVVITFNVHRNGAITDVTVIRPSEIDSFNTAAVNALLASNPTAPLPPEYPDEHAFFTVTFFYNETPPGQH